MALHFASRAPRKVAWAVFLCSASWTKLARYVLGSRCFRLLCLELGRLADLRESVALLRRRPECSSEATTVREGAGRTLDGDEEDTAEEPSEYRHTRPKKKMMNESRQTRGAATAAGASTSSSPGGVAEQIAAQQHPATHPAALSISRKMEMTAPPGE